MHFMRFAWLYGDMQDRDASFQVPTRVRTVLHL